MSALRHDRSSPSPLFAGPGDYPGWPVFDEEQRAAVDAVLASGRVNYWTGDEGRQFEREYAAAIGVDHAIAISNGTVAIELALQALGIGDGDEVVVPSRTFLATATSVVIRGATPVFADVDALSGNMTAATIEPLITANTRAIIAVHLAGWPCAMDEIVELADRHGLAVVEDCAQAHGAEHLGRPVGAWGQIGCFSFCQDKILTTGGEGGLVVTRDRELWRRMWSAKDHGKDWDAVYNKPHLGLFKWLHESIGTNARMTEMQSAIGRVQLRRLVDWVQTRRRNAAVFDRCLAGVPGLRLASPPADVRHSFYKYYVFLEESSLAPGWTRDRLAREIQQNGVPCGPGSCSEIYRERALEPWAPLQPCEHAHRLGETSLMLLVHPTLDVGHIESMSGVVRDVFHRAVNERPRVAA